MTKPTNHYIDNATFKVALLDYSHARLNCFNANLPQPIIPDYIAECFLLIARNLGNKHNFRYYSFLDDMISEATMLCLDKITNFDADRGTSPLAYFTQITWFSFLNTIKNERKVQNIKRAWFMRGDYATYSLGEGVSETTEGFNNEDREFHVMYNDLVAGFGSLGGEDPIPLTQASKRVAKFTDTRTALDTLYNTREVA